MPTSTVCAGHTSDAEAKPEPAAATTNDEATTHTCGCSTKPLQCPEIGRGEGIQRALWDATADLVHTIRRPHGA